MGSGREEPTVDHGAGPRVRPASRAEDAALKRIDRLTWTAEVSPAPAPPATDPFFGPGTAVDDVLVVEVNSNVAGYVKLGPVANLRSAAHVLEIKGLAVDPGSQRLGLGRALVSAAIDVSVERGARRLTLRVLGPNVRARSLYESCGFETEGILHELFLLEGQYVDDVIMALDLTARMP
jgi:ribosomal protein S18 acetylase RimI-like enzyme